MEEHADELEILRPKTLLTLYKDAVNEFLIPFDLGAGRYVPIASRAERRRAELEARKAAKKKNHC